MRQHKVTNNLIINVRVLGCEFINSKNFNNFIHNRKTSLITCFVDFLFILKPNFGASTSLGPKWIIIIFGLLILCVVRITEKKNNQILFFEVTLDGAYLSKSDTKGRLLGLGF